jgi:Tol biopolymer transport system component
VLAESADYLDRPAWRPDGAWIAYAARIDGNWDLWLVSADGTERHRLTAETQMETNPLWSPDGTMLAYKVAPDKQYNLTLQNVMTFEGGFEAPSIHAWDGPQSVQMSAWSPDGSAIAYTAEIVTDASGADRVSYAALVSDVALDGPAAVASATVPLARGQTLGDRGAYFSPDGSEVAFWAWDIDHNATLWLHDRATGTVERVTEGGPDLYPQWRPDGRALVFESTRAGTSDLWQLDLDGDG